MNVETMKQFILNNGEKEHRFQLPAENVLTHAATAELEPIGDVASALRQRLARPRGSNSLADRIQAGMHVTLICDDYTRPTPAQLLMPTLLNELNRLGVPDANITLLVAAGHHREMTQEEKTRKYGAEACRRVRLVHHSSMDESQLANIGTTSAGIPIWVNRRAVEADFTIGVGLVEIHPWAGFAGGGKIVSPGIAGRRTIDHTHALPIRPEVDIGKSEGNPFWESSAEAAEMLPLDLLINCLLDIQGRLVELAVGHPREAQLWLIDEFRRVNELRFQDQADVVITTAYPKYQAWGQAVIALYNAARIVRPGGVRIVLASCPEGLGDSDAERDFYWRSLTTPHESPEAYWENWLGEEMCHSRDTCAFHKAYCDSLVSEGIMVSHNLPTGMMHQPVYAELEDALEYAFAKCGQDAKTAVFDKGGMVLASTVAAAR